jgi:hypothetical protein
MPINMRATPRPMPSRLIGVVLLWPVVLDGIDPHRGQERLAVIVERLQLVTRGLVDAVPRLVRPADTKLVRAQLAQPHAELVDGQRVPVTMLVSVLDVASMENLADHIVGPTILAGVEQEA